MPVEDRWTDRPFSKSRKSRSAAPGAWLFAKTLNLSEEIALHALQMDGRTRKQSMHTTTLTEIQDFTQPLSEAFLKESDIEAFDKLSEDDIVEAEVARIALFGVFASLLQLRVGGQHSVCLKSYALRFLHGNELSCACSAAR